MHKTIDYPSGNVCTVPMSPWAYDSFLFLLVHDWINAPIQTDKLHCSLLYVSLIHLE